MSLDQESITRASSGHLVDLHHSFVRALTVGIREVAVEVSVFGPVRYAVLPS